MNDAKGRPIKIGDWIASPDLHVEGGIPIKGMILGQVLEICDGDLYLGDDISYDAQDIITRGGYFWVDCLSCNTPWVKDIYRDETCPFCGSAEFVQDVQASPASVAACRVEDDEQPSTVAEL